MFKAVGRPATCALEQQWRYSCTKFICRQTAKRTIHHAARNAKSTSQNGYISTGATIALLGGYVAYQVSNQAVLKMDAPFAPPSKLEQKSRLSSQHDQVMQFWERPGVYLWGSNSGRVAAPDSDDAFVKAPRRFSFFDGYVLRDLKLAREMGVAVTEDGDIMQWGSGYAGNIRNPEITLKGKNIFKVGLSLDRIVALSRSGTVYSIPFSKEEQENYPKPNESSWIPFWTSSKSKISYRNLTPELSGWETIVDIAVGLDHTLMLTSSGRVFTAASATTSFPEKGQLGVPGLSWATRPKPYDTPQEVLTLKGFRIAQIAAGSYHNIVTDEDGKIFSWGDNTNGQLGVDYAADFVPTPSILPPRTFYKDHNIISKCTQIYAGGINSYFVMETTPPQLDPKRPSTTLCDVFACGSGISGSLGNGFWTHAQGLPQKIKSLSGLSEYSDRLQRVVPIRLAYMTVGGSHVAAVMSNLTNVSASQKKENDINFGADILFFGGNEFYQLGTGKRNNAPNPTYIPRLDAGPDITSAKREEHRFQVTPAKKVQIMDQNSKKRSTTIEQRVIAGRGLTGCYAMAV